MKGCVVRHPAFLQYAQKNEKSSLALIARNFSRLVRRRFLLSHCPREIWEGVRVSLSDVTAHSGVQGPVSRKSR